ncbi:MAG: hypothetical protein PQ965_06450 [Methanobacteriaceae archaeon]
MRNKNKYRYLIWRVSDLANNSPFRQLQICFKQEVIIYEKDTYINYSSTGISGGGYFLYAATTRSR